MVQLHHLARLARAVVLDPLHADALAAEVLRVLEGVPMPDVRLAGRLRAVVPGGVRTDALVHEPEVVLDPHGLVHLQDDCGGVREDAEDASELHVVVRAGRLAADVVVLRVGVLAAVAELLDGVVLREKAKAEGVRLPADEGVGVATLLAVLELHGEGLRVQGRRHGRHVHLRRGRDGLARRHLDVLVLVGPSVATDALAEAAPRPLVLVAAALAVPALRVAVVRAVELRVQGVRGRGAGHAGVVRGLGGVAPVTGVWLLDAHADVALVLALAAAARPLRPLREQGHGDIASPQLAPLVLGQVVRPPHHRLAAVRLALGLEQVRVVAHDGVEPPPMSTVLVDALEQHLAAVLGSVVDLLQLVAPMLRDQRHEGLQLLGAPLAAGTRAALSAPEVAVEHAAELRLAWAPVAVARLLRLRPLEVCQARHRRAASLEAERKHTRCQTQKHGCSGLGLAGRAGASVCAKMA
mmetsp:Transcript_64319/g.199538  ORF Transcript_64319/g.199538 Transcript_64319/m.199538 type:complete len:467 (-) Transcript_64319:3-1403(-)